MREGVHTRPLGRRVLGVGIASVLTAIALVAVVLAGIHESGKGSKPHLVAFSKQDRTPPSTPSSVTAQYYGGVGSALSWKKVTSSDLDHYNVYESAATISNVTSSSVVRVSSPAASATSYTDPKTYGTAYTAASTAVDAAGNESKPSSSVSIRTPDKTAPAVPSSLTATATQTGITLKWAANHEPDLASYQVSSATSSSGPFTVLTTAPASATTYTDTAATAGVRTYYRLAAVDKSGNASAPATANATGTATVTTSSSTTSTTTALSTTSSSTTSSSTTMLAAQPAVWPPTNLK